MAASAFGRLFERVFGAATGVMLAAITGLTTVDVVGRYLFNRPVRGAFELTEVLMALLIFAALPLVSLRQEHVAVDLLDSSWPPPVRRALLAAIQLASAIILGVLGWVMMGQARQAALDRLFTDTLRIPLSPVLWFGAAAIIIAALVHLLVVVRSRRHEHPHP